ncbi:flippase-like domain-containing protein [Flavobacteriaceae bacterium S0825]|uniref:lysylphosphatidylglycerol synthase transmembrane domain-containing protein n=1 Tax=Gaetbulibacter sp. S0825 TaxID=2720084 RepID=UPI00142FD0DC|nr:lysylphosphatidylglycerol synthase transmembrane domain-containing protein [Gaetbulibacter sp. S0825]MCK0108080.1 flippase-like domain-containing protein [Flavobacteriaceae bacterium S0825]NIX63716.1 flippase-like domain-containing protein [Gaetbulibacter sp. S0825]
MSKQTKNVIKIILPLILGVVLIWYSLSKMPMSELLSYFKEANYTWIGLGVLLGVLSHLSRAYRWKFMINPMGYKLHIPNSFMAVMAAYLINYTIPRAGEISRASIVANYEGIPFEKGFGTIVAERIADLVMMLLIIAITLFLEFEYIYDFFAERFDPNKILIGVAGLIVISIVFVLFIRRSNSKLALKIKGFVVGLIEGVLSIFKMKQKWAFVGHTLFIWLMYVLMFYVTTFAVDETSGIPLAAILIGFISGSFSIAATNGGVGSYPVAIFLAFSIFGIAEDAGMAFGWIMWTAQTLMVIVLGGLSLLFLPIYNKNREKTQTS